MNFMIFNVSISKIERRILMTILAFGMIVAASIFANLFIITPQGDCRRMKEMVK